MNSFSDELKIKIASRESRLEVFETSVILNKRSPTTMATTAHRSSLDYAV